jgi:dihydropteroate synthase
MSAHPVLDCAGRFLVLDRPRVMGILNVTPDSFSDGGKWFSLDEALKHARAMAVAGADLIDIGGESTRPGSRPVGAIEEAERVVPLIETLSGELDIPLSVDTGKPEVMRAAIEAGAGMINDVYALQQPGALETAAELAVPICLMHMQGRPGNMQQAPLYKNVVTEISAFLLGRVEACRALGIPPERLLLDPGFGFGKTLDHNLELFRALPRLSALGYPLLVGLSRKSMLGQLTGRRVEERLAASLAAAVEAVRAGALVLRVHDVAETVDALRVLSALDRD